MPRHTGGKRKAGIDAPEKAPDAPRPDSPKYSAKRQEVLRAAARVFARLGFHRASLTDVGEALSMTPPAVYYYVKSKEELLYACSAFALEQILSALEEAKREGETGLDKVRIFYRRYAELICDDFGRCLVLSSPDDLGDEMREQDQSARRALDREVRAMVRLAVQDGSLRECDPRSLTALLFGALNSVSRWWSPRGPLSPAQIADLYLGIVIEGVGPLPPRAKPATARRGAQRESKVQR